jgi:dihydropteroate synthase
LIVDPGIGFGKTLDHNLQLLANLDRFLGLGAPVLVGASRKRFIAALDRSGPAEERLGGSLAAAVEGWRRGASILRVHDVAATRQALAVTAAIENAGPTR